MNAASGEPLHSDLGRTVLSGEVRCTVWRLGLRGRTGKTVFKVHTGNGIPYDNAWAPITIGPDVTYVSTFGGLLAVRDGA